MLRFIKTETDVDEPTNILETTNQLEQQQPQAKKTRVGNSEENTISSQYMKLDLNALPTDPGVRPKLRSYDVNQRAEIRIAYLLKGPFQPRDYAFPLKKYGAGYCKFNPAWFDEYKYWLEYSIEKDAAFCLCCYLFVSDICYRGLSHLFLEDGWKCWNLTRPLHVHNAGNPHILAVIKFQSLMSQFQSTNTSDLLKTDHQIRLNPPTNTGNHAVADDASKDDAVKTQSTQAANENNGQSSQSCCSGMEGLVDALLKKREEQISVVKTNEALLKKLEGQISVLAEREVAGDKVLADKRARLNGELKRIPILSLQARLRAVSVIVGDPA